MKKILTAGLILLISQLTFNSPAYARVYVLRGKHGWYGTISGKLRDPELISCNGNSNGIKGLYFYRYRRGKSDMDTYRFRLICRRGRSELAGVYAGNLVSSHAIICKGRGALARGLYFQRYRRGRGDYDTYKFQLICTDNTRTRLLGSGGDKQAQSNIGIGF